MVLCTQLNYLLVGSLKGVIAVSGLISHLTNTANSIVGVELNEIKFPLCITFNVPLLECHLNH